MVNKMLSWSAYQTTATSFGIETFQDEPKKVIDMFFEVNDVSVSLPTGYGKIFNISSSAGGRSPLFSRRTVCSIFTTLM